MKIQTPIDPTPLREKAYPKTGDQLDCIIKTFKYLKAQGVDLGEDGDFLIQKSDEVKNKYKKK